MSDIQQLGDNWQLFEGGKIDLNKATVLVKILIKVGFGATKIPGDKLKKPGAAEVFAANGGSSSDSLQIFQCIWTPLTERECQIAGTRPNDPVRRKPVQPGTQIIISPQWASNKLKAELQEIQAQDMESEGDGSGFYVAKDRYPAVEAKIQQLEEFGQELLEILTRDEVFDSARSNFEQRLSLIDEVANFDPAEFDRILSKFPRNADQFRSKFRVTNTPPVERPSLIEQLSGNAEAMEALATTAQSQSEIEYLAAVQASRRRALADAEAVQREALNRVVDDLCSHVAEVLTDLETINQESIGIKLKKRLETHSAQCGKILQVIEGIAGVNPLALEEMVEATEQIRSEFLNPASNREELTERLKALKSSVKQTVSLVAEGEGSRALASWCQIVIAEQQEAEAPVVSAASSGVVIADDEDEEVQPPAPAPPSIDIADDAEEDNGFTTFVAGGSSLAGSLSF